MKGFVTPGPRAPPPARGKSPAHPFVTLGELSPLFLAPGFFFKYLGYLCPLEEVFGWRLSPLGQCSPGTWHFPQRGKEDLISLLSSDN